MSPTADDIRHALAEHAGHVSAQREHATTPAAAGIILVLPFIRNVLGYTPENAEQVLPHYTPDPGGAGDRYADYLLKADGRPAALVFVETTETVDGDSDAAWAKRAGPVFAAAWAAVEKNREDDAATAAILTDGTRYSIRMDCGCSGELDPEPAVEIDARSPDGAAAETLAMLAREGYDARVLRSAAIEAGIGDPANVLRKELAPPSRAIARLVTERLGQNPESEDVVSAVEERLGMLEITVQRELEVVGRGIRWRLMGNEGFRTSGKTAYAEIFEAVEELFPGTVARLAEKNPQKKRPWVAQDLDTLIEDRKNPSSSLYHHLENGWWLWTALGNADFMLRLERLADAAGIPWGNGMRGLKAGVSKTDG